MGAIARQPQLPRLTAALALCWAAGAAADPLPWPQAQCAAFWLGRDDFAARSAFLDRDPADRDRAAALRAEAIRLGGDAGAIDAFIAAERPGMRALTEATIWGDRTSRELHDRLAALCAG